MSKTSVSILQELMVKRGTIPHYEFVSQTGPQHVSMFEYRCTAEGVTVSAIARSKKDAKQEVAKAMLEKLAIIGVKAQTCYNERDGSSSTTNEKISTPLSVGKSYVAILKELCEEFKLPAVVYDLVGDTGPAHLRKFTMRARMGGQEHIASATTKKAARQMAAELLYNYLRENMAITKTFVEEDAIARAHERAMERYVEIVDHDPWRPDMGQKISNYHLGLLSVDPSKRQLFEESVTATVNIGTSVKALEAGVAALGLEIEWCSMDCLDGKELTLARVMGLSPPLCAAGTNREMAAEVAMASLTRQLSWAKTSSKTSSPEKYCVG